MTFTHALATNNYGPAKFIVDSSAANGTHTTIAAALTSASSGDTIFIRPGSYTENLTLKAGVNLCAYTCDASLNNTANVKIIGKLSFSSAGSVSISGMEIQTNSDNLLAVTGSAASIVNFSDCFINCSNNTGISFTTTNASAKVTFQACTGDLGTTGISYFVCTTTGVLSFQYSIFRNSGASSTASTSSAGSISFNYVQWSNPITTTSTGAFNGYYCTFNSNTNTIALTHGGSGANSGAEYCDFVAGSASAISIGAGATLLMYGCVVSSSNTNAITGSGSLTNAGIFCVSSSSVFNTSSITGKNLNVGGISFDNGSNTLTIFQQGTFSPTVIGASTAGTVNMTVQVGRYQKIGRIVTVSMDVDWTTIGTATGQAEVNNLPFTMANVTSLNSPSICTSDANNLTTASGAVPLFQPSLNTAVGKINYYLGSTGAGTAGTITATNGFNTMSIYETT